MIRLGLCCTFLNQPIKFRTTTAAYLTRQKAKSEDPILHLNAIVSDNIASLDAAIDYCYDHQIGAFRINSQFLPLATHPHFAYTIDMLPDGETHLERLKKIKTKREKTGLRLSFHPDQFVVLSSPKKSVVKNSLAEIEYQTIVADLIGADVINIHGGGGYGDKPAALTRFASSFAALSPSAQSKLTVENDDKTYSPEELLPLCHDLKIPLVYDLHHHRCNKDSYSIEKATELALQTWNREPYFHISSPINGWNGKTPSRHHDYIDIDDVPIYWKRLSQLTIDVEAKAKEEAVLRLQSELRATDWQLFPQ